MSIRGRCFAVCMGLSFCTVAVVATDSACAQGPAVSVQQPVFGLTGVATTVSVPDRGRVGLGSVARGASGRTSAGIGLRNRGRFNEVSHTGISVGVTIHDFEEMDRAALSAPVSRQRSRTDESTLSPRAAHAWKTLGGRR